MWCPSASCSGEAGSSRPCSPVQGTGRIPALELFWKVVQCSQTLLTLGYLKTPLTPPALLDHCWSWLDVKKNTLGVTKAGNRWPLLSESYMLTVELEVSRSGGGPPGPGGPWDAAIGSCRFFGEEGRERQSPLGDGWTWRKEVVPSPYHGAPALFEAGRAVPRPSCRGSRTGHSGVYACPQFLTQSPCSSMCVYAPTRLTMKKQETLIFLNQAKLPWGRGWGLKLGKRLRACWKGPATVPLSMVIMIT